MMYSYSIENGWSEIDDFLHEAPGTFPQALSTCGYYSLPSISYSDQFCQFRADVFTYRSYADDGKHNEETGYDFIVHVSVGTVAPKLAGPFHERIAVTNFPSLVELMHRLSTINHAGTANSHIIEKNWSSSKKHK